MNATAKSTRVPRSMALYARAMHLIPGATQLISRRPSRVAYDVSPVYATRAKGARFWDVDGFEYIDWISGIGSILLGYGDPVVDDAVREQIAAGTIYSVNHELEIELAEELCRAIPCAEMVRYAKCGGEACAIAVRIAEVSRVVTRSSSADITAGMIGIWLPTLPRKRVSMRTCFLGSNRSACRALWQAQHYRLPTVIWLHCVNCSNGTEARWLQSLWNRSVPRFRPTVIWRASASSLANTARSSSSTRSRPDCDSVRAARSSSSVSRQTWLCLPNRCRTATRWRRWWASER